MEKNCKNCKYFEIFKEKYFRCNFYYKKKHYYMPINKPEEFICENYEEKN